MIPRPLKQFDEDRRKKLLQLAFVLLDTAPQESTGRTVNYFLKLCDRDAVPDPVPQLLWIEERVSGDFDALDMLDTNNCRPMERLMPQMRFVARLGRPS